MPILREGDWECKGVNWNSSVPTGLREQFYIMVMFCESKQWGLCSGHLPGLCYSSNVISRTSKNLLTLFTFHLIMCLKAFKPKYLSLSFIGNITTERRRVVNLTSSSCVICAPGHWSSEETLLLKK